MIGRVAWLALACAVTIARSLRRRTRVFTTPALAPSHATHVWAGKAIYDTVPFRGADNPLLDVMDSDQWHELEREAVDV